MAADESDAAGQEYPHDAGKKAGEAAPREAAEKSGQNAPGRKDKEENMEKQLSGFGEKSGKRGRNRREPACFLKNRIMSQPAEWAILGKIDPESQQISKKLLTCHVTCVELPLARMQGKLDSSFSRRVGNPADFLPCPKGCMILSLHVLSFRYSCFLQLLPS
ncbi:MAG: hypothetical protein LBO00_00785 [Zoogloeaceae bacterium]|nr:hypothetical protein [Zoogloeaceae bacterium]